MRPEPSLLSRRLNIVTGKGGVGKSTVTAALALVAQSRGLRVLCCEVTAKETVSALLGAPPSGTTITQIDKSIWSVHVRPQEAMREYGLMVLRFKAVYSAVFENRVVRYFLRAVPSLPEIVMLGKVWWHVAQDRDETGRLRWDLVLLDAPATGHGITFLGTPRTILELVSEGPMVRDMRNMQQTLLDPAQTAVHLVSLPEEMPANEAVDLYGALHGRLELPLGRLFLNAVFEPRFAADERRELEQSDEPELQPARIATRFYGERQDLTAHYAEKLGAAVDLPMVRIPFYAGEEFGRATLEKIAQRLGREI